MAEAEMLPGLHGTAVPGFGGELGTPKGSGQATPKPSVQSSTPSHGGSRAVPLRGSPARALAAARPRSASESALPTLGGTGLSRKERTGPFYDVDRAGGTKSSMTTCINFTESRHALMRTYSDGRFKGIGGESFGLSGLMPRSPHLGPRSPHSSWTKEDAEEEDLLPDPSFRSGCLRVPVNSQGWIVLRNRTSEVNDATLMADERARWKRFNGTFKGAPFSREKRLS
mmetsp:Transcript_77797/g.172325  ORF Transcript_77797/g.172325 Transcript_77797/m.172325 type:complete len:227 (-) Transcript_77797:100-780(-)